MRNILIFLFICILHSTALAEEYLSHEVNCYGTNVQLDFLIKDDVVLVDVAPLSKALDLEYLSNKNKNAFLFHQRGSKRNYIFFNGKNTASFNYFSLTTPLQMPSEAVFENEKMFIPFDFFLRLINTSYRFSPGELYISRPRLTSLDSIDTTLTERYLFDIYDDFDINRGLGRIYRFLTELISTTDSCMSGQWDRIKYLSILSYSNVVEKDRIDQLIKLLIPVQSFEVQQDNAEREDMINNLLFAATYLLTEVGGEDLQKIIDGIRQQNLVDAVNSLDKMYATYIRLHGNAMPTDMERLYKKINLLTKESKFLDYTRMGTTITSKVFDVILGASEFINRNEAVISGLTVLCNNRTHVKTYLSSSTYKSIQREMASYKTMHTRMLHAFFDVDLISKAISFVLPATELTALFWDIASEQFLSEIISGSENYILATYGMALSYDLANTTQYLRNEALSGNLSDSAKLHDLLSIGYLFAKTCYTTRALGLTSSIEISTAVRNEHETIQNELKELLTNIGTATLGYLPKDEADYLKHRDDTRLIDFLRSESLPENPLLGIWHAQMQTLGSTIVFPIIFTQDTLKLYGYGDKPKTVPVIYKKEHEDWFFSENAGKSWCAVSFQDKNTFVMMQKGSSIVCTKAASTFPEGTNPLLGKWHATLKTFGSTGILPMTFTETCVKIDKPGGSATIPIQYKTENQLWFISDDNGKSWQPASFKDANNLIILIHRFPFVCTRIVSNK